MSSIKIVIPPGHELIECPQCGGYGGEPGSNFGDYGWHSCYKCGELGWIVVPIRNNPSNEGNADAKDETTTQG